MSRIIGIDFGTTNSVVSVLENEQPIVIPNRRGERLTPSVVCFSANGELLVGTRAKNQIVLYPNRTVAFVKRSMGADVAYEIDGKQYTPCDIASIILKRLKEDTEIYLDQSITQAVITVPAYFTDRQRSDVKKAGERAGLDVMRIINEPTASCLRYGFGKEEGEIILVYDLGGGTFDVSILETIVTDEKEASFEVLAVRGNNHLGGNDFDLKIVNHIIEHFNEQTGIDLAEDKLAYQKLITDAERAKKDLSEADSASINIPFITADTDGPKHLELEITQTLFENLVAPYIDETIELTQEAINDAGLRNDDIDRVILVGGSTRIPLVKESLEQFVSATISRDINPDECVAEGAAIEGGIISRDITGIVLVDVTPFSLGVKNEPDVFVPVIEKNTAIPTAQKKLFTTLVDNQQKVEIEVYQGESPRASDNEKLGVFELTNISGARAGEPRIEVTFDIDVNGIVHVSAQDLDTGSARDIRIVTKKDAVVSKESKPAGERQDTSADADNNVIIEQANETIQECELLLANAASALPRTLIKEMEQTLEMLKQDLSTGNLDEAKKRAQSVSTLKEEIVLRSDG